MLFWAQVALPAIPDDQRFEVTALGAPGCYSVLCRAGFRDALGRDAAFLDALVGAVAEDIRFRALVAKCASAPLIPPRGSWTLHPWPQQGDA